MIDIKLLRTNPDLIRRAMEDRGVEAPIDDLLQVDKDRRARITEVEALKHKRNQVSVEIGELKKKGKPATAKIEEMRILSDNILEFDRQIRFLDEKTTQLLFSIPNLPHETVPRGHDSQDNQVMRTWGKPVKFSFQAKDHTELGTALDLIDVERAAKTSGARFYYLKNSLFLMGLALTSFTVHLLAKKGFTPMETPFMLRREAIQGAVPLTDFEDVIYKVEDEDLHLIGTAEHALLAYHMGETFDPKELPKLYVGYSTNFRKEAGAHGKDTKGIFRVHQFDKVEQFAFAKPEDSWQIHEQLIQNAEELYQKLKIPYRVVSLCTGDLGKASAKTYDLEAWFAAQQMYREVVSASNCTDWQSRRLNIKYRAPEGNQFVHTLNSTAVAIQRTLAAILENYQREDGTVTVPDALQPYMNHQQEIRPHTTG